MFKKLMLVAAVVVASTGFSPVVLAQSPGNNGTLKVHELGTPSGTESNDPKVCIFNFEGFQFDAGQTGYIRINGQGQSSGTNYGDFDFGPTNADGYYATAYFNQQGGTTIADGQYKATLYGKDNEGQINLDDEKAKSKVFKVQCARVPETPEIPEVPEVPETPEVPEAPGVTLGERTQVVTPVGGVKAGGGSVAASLFGLGSSVAALGYGALRLRKND